MHCLCCVFRILIAILVLTLSIEAQNVSVEHPKCRTANPRNCQYDNSSSHRHTFYFIVNGTMGSINQIVIVEYKEAEESFKLVCRTNMDQIDYKLPVDDPALPVMPRPVTVKTVTIVGCTVPLKSSYHDVLAALNVRFSESEDTNLVMVISELLAEPHLEGYHIEGLPVKRLVITAEDDSVHYPKFDFLDKIQKLQNLELLNIVLDHDVIERLPEGLVHLKLKKTQLPAAESSLNNGSFWLERLQSLDSLYLVEAETSESTGFKLLPPPLASLPNLTSAQLYYVPMKPLPQNWLKGSKLQTLLLESCGIEKLPNNLFNGVNLTTLDLNDNRLSSLPNGIFSPLRWLKKLDLSNNNLNSMDLVNSMDPLTQLENLNVNNNPRLGSLCGDDDIIEGNHYSPLPHSLRYLGLKKTGATRICTDWIEKDTFLMHIALDYNIISDLNLSKLIMKRDASLKNTPVILSLQNNTKRFRVTQYDYNKCLSTENGDWGNPKPVPVELRLNNLACECYEGYWLRETLRNCSLLTISETPACNRTLLAQEPQDFTCPYEGFCTTGCACRRRALDNATVMRCSDGLSSDPQWPPLSSEWPLVLHIPPGTLTTVPPLKLIEFYAPYNNITSIDEKDIPNTLLKLDVSNNNITHITANAAQKLLRQRTSILISGNPLACGCEDASAIAKLKLAEVRDWNLTQCADGTPLGKTSIEKCESKINKWILPVVTSVIVLFIVLVALVLRRLLPQIRQFLFDHNICLKWVLNVNDDPQDPMKNKDAFISYSYNDYEYAKILVEKLEEHGYSTIEHCRDWLPGIPVTEQITHSVMSARRTLLLVSDNFSSSEWGMKEFHAAHAHAMAHGSARVIIVRCQLLAPHKLPPEMQLYLYNNTYLDWRDHYFWDKLWRVMPTPRSTPASAIALIPHQEALPSVEIRLTLQETNTSALSHSWQSVDEDPPLSELVLGPHVSAEDSPRQPSARILPITQGSRQPPPSSENNSSLSCKIQFEPAPLIPAGVSPCAC